MKNFKKISVLLAFIMLMLFAACEKKNNDVPPPPEDNLIYITEHITVPTTWYEGKIYIVDINGDFNIGALLTIEPNVIVKFLKEDQRIYISNGGVISAIGTPEKPIIFTSPNDDFHGGDNTGNGPTPPAPGDWGKFYFNNVSTSEFSFCQFFYGGGLILPTVEVIASTIDINNCLFAYNLGGKHASNYIGVVQLDLANQDCQITNNVFYNNVLPMSINANINIDNSNTFSNPEDSLIVNAMNGIFTENYTIDVNVSWQETEVPFVVANGSGLRVESNGSLSLSDNVVIKVIEGSVIDLVNNPNFGILNSDGPGVYFTSFHDDSMMGDTDGNGTNIMPMNGDWDGIRIALNPLTYADWPNILYD